MTNKLTLPDIHEALKAQKFSSFDDWVNTAQRKLAVNHRDEKFRQSYKTPPEDERAICFDTKGRRCFIGRDFMRARDEQTFPVHFIWPDQMISLAMLVPLLAQLIEMEKPNAHGF